MIDIKEGSKRVDWKSNIKLIHTTLNQKLRVVSYQKGEHFVWYSSRNMGNIDVMVEFVYNEKLGDFSFALRLFFQEVSDNDERIMRFFDAFVSKTGLGKSSVFLNRDMKNLKGHSFRLGNVSGILTMDGFYKCVDIAVKFFREVKRVKRSKPRGVLKV